MAEPRPIEVPKPGWNEAAREFNLRRDATVLRGPVEWSWDVTNECPGRCLHCFNRSGVVARDELRHEEMLEVAEQIAELSPLGICLCGGEPLRRIDSTLEVARVLTDAGTSVNMVTNGLLVTPGVTQRVKDAGIVMVQVSLDGADAQSHERLRLVPGLFDAAVNAIRSLREADLVVGVSFTPTRWNITQWRTVYDMCAEMGVFELRIQPLMPIGEGQLHYTEISPSENQYRQLVREYMGVLVSPECEMQVEWGDPVDHLIRFGQFYSMIPYNMHLTSDGFLVPSVYLPVVLGNVRRHRIDEYWENGLNMVWQLRLVRELAYRIRSNRDFSDIRPNPGFDAPIDVDLLDRSTEEIEHITDVVLDFIDKVAPDRARPAGPWAWRPTTPSNRGRMEAVFGENPSSHFRAQKPAETEEP